MQSSRQKTLHNNINCSLSCRAGAEAPAFLLKKNEQKHTEVILVLPSKWHNSQKVLILQKISPSPNFEKVDKTHEIGVKMKNEKWIKCPVCGNNTRTRIRPDTVLKNFPLFFPKCKQETLIDAKEIFLYK